MDVEYDMAEEDYFRPTELITYYIAKLITKSHGKLSNTIHNWMYRIAEDYEDESLVADSYFRVFLEGRMIYHADKYYTDYVDYEEVLSYYKDI